MAIFLDSGILLCAVRWCRARWPGEGAEINFKFSKWTVEPSVEADGIQFATPRECKCEQLEG